MEGCLLKIHQLRYADEALLKDEVKYISIRLCPKIQSVSTGISHFKIYEEKYRLKITDIKQNLSTVILRPEDELNLYTHENQNTPLFPSFGAFLPDRFPGKRTRRKRLQSFLRRLSIPSLFGLSHRLPLVAGGTCGYAEAKGRTEGF